MSGPTVGKSSIHKAGAFLIASLAYQHQSSSFKDEGGDSSNWCSSVLHTTTAAAAKYCNNIVTEAATASAH